MGKPSALRFNIRGGHQATAPTSNHIFPLAEFLDVAMSATSIGLLT
jgi:hypothetical protein